METSIKAQASKREEWFKIVQDFNDSGLTQVGYCRQHNINKDHFAYYLSRWRSKQTNATKDVPFIELQVAEPLSATTKLILNITNGMSLEIPQSISMQQLAELVITLRARSC